MIQTRCPICDRLLEAETLADLPYFPFCGERCRLIDLGRWLGESYRIQAPEGEAPAPPADETDIP